MNRPANILSVVIDIETCVPNADTCAYVEQKLSKTVDAPSNYKDPAAIQRYISEKIAASIERLSLHPNFAEIVCIGIKMNDQPAFAFSRETDELTMLKQFSDWLLEHRNDSITFFGKGIKRFDFAILRTRLMVHGFFEAAKMLSFNRYETSFVRDLEDSSVWPGNDQFNKQYASLSDIAFVLGLGDSVNLDFTGANVQLAWEEGDIKSVVDHCIEDVEVCYNIFKAIGEVF